MDGPRPLRAAPLDRVERLADDRRVRRVVAQVAAKQRPDHGALGLDQPPQPGRLGDVERALERLRRVVVFGQRVERHGVQEPALGAHRQQDAFVRGPVARAEVRLEHGTRPRRVAVEQAQPGDGVGHRARGRGLALGPLEQRARRLALPDRGAEQPLLGHHQVVQGRQQGPVAELLARRQQDVQRGLGLAGVGQQQRAVEAVRRAQRSIPRVLDGVPPRAPRRRPPPRAGRAAAPRPRGRCRPRPSGRRATSRAARRARSRRRPVAPRAGPRRERPAPPRDARRPPAPSSPSAPRPPPHGLPRGAPSPRRGRRSTARRCRAGPARTTARPSPGRRPRARGCARAARARARARRWDRRASGPRRGPSRPCWPRTRARRSGATSASPSSARREVGLPRRRARRARGARRRTRAPARAMRRRARAASSRGSAAAPPSRRRSSWRTSARWSAPPRGPRRLPRRRGAGRRRRPRARRATSRPADAAAAPRRGSCARSSARRSSANSG